jgi:hypothetical protein
MLNRRIGICMTPRYSRRRKCRRLVKKHIAGVLLSAAGEGWNLGQVKGRRGRIEVSVPRYWCGPMSQEGFQLTARYLPRRSGQKRPGQTPRLT